VRTPSSRASTIRLARSAVVGLLASLMTAGIANAQGQSDIDVAFDGKWETTEATFVFHGRVTNVGAREASARLELGLFGHTYEPIPSAAPQGCSKQADNTFQCNLGSLAPGKSRTIDLTIERPACGAWIEAWGTVTADGDTATANNGGQERIGFDPPTCPHEADTLIEGSASRDKQDRAKFSYTFRNLGPGPTEKAFFYILPTSNQFEVEWAVDPPVAGCKFAHEWEMYCDFGTLQKDESRTITLKQVSGDCGEVSAHASSNFPNEADYGNNNVDHALPGCGLGGLKVNAELKRTLDNQTQLMFVVEALGPNPALDVTAELKIPPTKEGWSRPPDECSLEGDRLLCAWPSLSPAMTNYHYLWTNSTDECIVVEVTIHASNDKHPEDDHARAALPGCTGVLGHVRAVPSLGGVTAMLAVAAMVYLRRRA
jgi:hypothetical protein